MSFENYVPSESEEQQAVFVWAYVMAYRDPRLVLLFHIPNGGSRPIVTAARMKQEGVRAGVPDLFLPAPAGEWHGLFIEMMKKDRKNKPTKEQKMWIDALQEQGYRAEVAYGADAAIKILKDYLGIE